MNDRIRGQVKQLFEQQLERQVTVLLFHDENTPGENQFVGASREVLGELADLSGGKIRVTEHHLERDAQVARQYGVGEAPVLVFLDADGNDQNFRFWGAPLGYEFSTLLEDLVDVSKGVTRLTEAGREQIRAVEQDVEILVFSTPG
jgi:alkyl hydroperoxide reductase subunit AhpF